MYPVHVIANALLRTKVWRSTLKTHAHMALRRLVYIRILILQADRAQLEFVQILVIVVVMMMMVVVITCLLNHYRLSAQSFISRHGQARQRHISLTSDGGLWSSEVSGSSSGMSEQVYVPRPPAQVPPYLQREHLCRFQSTYPYFPHAVIDLPPNISLSDGEEPPPYQGLCTIQLRDPEQQLELNRESVRAPPNRTVFDSPFIDVSLCPPSVNAGISAASLECDPPAYSKIIGHYYSHASLLHQSETPAGAGVASPFPLIQGNLQTMLPHISSTESQITPSKEKQTANQVLPFTSME
ncbi:protein TMEPAI isoform X2 [Brachyhypopomus gauderio]|uniref:protein TMEPAI isoform X2 n=1 Tax=Brachyhypopomus gauderio TaxID=698409 RepID=UPI0040424360